MLYSGMLCHGENAILARMLRGVMSGRYTDIKAL